MVHDNGYLVTTNGSRRMVRVRVGFANPTLIFMVRDYRFRIMATVGVIGLVNYLS